MKKCKHKNITRTNVISGGYNIPVGTIEEYDIICKDCGEWLAHWSYGSVIDISKSGRKRLGYKYPIYRKILDYIKWRKQLKIDDCDVEDLF